MLILKYMNPMEYARSSDKVHIKHVLVALKIKHLNQNGTPDAREALVSNTPGETAD